MENENLFIEFPPISTQEWEEKIVKDLKGADINKKLIWHSDEGFDVAPFYRKEDLEKLPHVNTFPSEHPYLRGKTFKNNFWKIDERISVKNILDANRHSKNAVKNGAESLTFTLVKNFIPDKKNLLQLFSSIDLSKISIHIETDNPLLAVDSLREISHDITGSVFYDPVTLFSRNGKFTKSRDEDIKMVSKLMKASFLLPFLQTVNIDATLFANAGANSVTTMAYALSIGTLYLDYLTDNGFDAENIFKKMRFHFATGSNYFMEIAKHRALRYLWAKIAESYGIKGKEAAMTIHSTNSSWNKTIYDPYVNMLRTTTETMSAIIGGADEITTMSFDALNPLRPETSMRIARNQQLILREESYLNKVKDVAAGSYYIETITDKLISSAWELFINIEDSGGYLEAFNKGIIQNRIEEEANKKDIDIAMRKKNILGVNQFPNITEHFNVKLSNNIFTPSKKEDNITKVIKPYRGAAAFEALRYKTDCFAITNRRPKVWIFTYGNLSMRRTRAQFAGNFFGCAGFEIIDNNGFASIEDGITEAKNFAPEIVVLCSSDEDYRKTAITIYEALTDIAIVVLAGYPQPLVKELEQKGFKHFIHVKSNMLEELQKFQRLMKI